MFMLTDEAKAATPATNKQIRGRVDLRPDTLSPALLDDLLFSESIKSATQ